MAEGEISTGLDLLMMMRPESKAVLVINVGYKMNAYVHYLHDKHMWMLVAEEWQASMRSPHKHHIVEALKRITKVEKVNKIMLKNNEGKTVVLYEKKNTGFAMGHSRRKSRRGSRNTKNSRSRGKSSKRRSRKKSTRRSR